jgi:hypothetical protein
VLEIRRARAPSQGSLQGRRAIPRGMETLRLSCATFWVDVRLREMNGRWLASADTPDGPSLRVGLGAMEAIEAALEPFHGIVDELMASLADASP